MKESNRFVIYYRVSTKVQCDSGLGLEAQKSIIKHYIPAGSIEREFTEIASAKSITARPVLQATMAYCLEHGCTLAVANSTGSAERPKMPCRYSPSSRSDW